MRSAPTYILTLFSFILLSGSICAQSIEIFGTIKETVSQSPVPFATVVAISTHSDRVLNGSTSDDTGAFMLTVDSADFRIEIRAIGFDTYRVDSVTVQAGKVDLGSIQLGSAVQDVEEVKVTAERSSMEFKLDKRVFNVGKDISSTGMGALEVLNNVPSVNVDIEGNVTLRGNSGVQILIDGKPSAMSDDPSKALGTLTADMIESIEVITNPSAKYEAGGTSGIINIILKKEEKKGFNGSVSVNTGIPHNHSVGASLNLRTEKFNFFTQFGGGYRSLPDYDESSNRNKENLAGVDSEGEGFRNEQFYNITIGADYFLNKYNTLTLSGNFAYELERNPSRTGFRIYDTLGNLVSEYDRVETTSGLNPKWQYDVQYKKQFKNNKDHVLLFSTLGRFFGKDQASEFSNEYISGTLSAFDQRTEADFYQSDYTFKLDYTNPITKRIGLELGSMYEINDVGNDYAVYNLGNTGWDVDSSLTNDFQYNQKVFGVYGTGSYEGDKWGVKLGLRAENTDLQTVLTTTNQVNNQRYTNLFPSVHTSYKFTKKFSVQAGYSRRIYRPRLWDLNPFFNIQNNFNIRTGNPNLMPEFADSYELTSIFFFGKLSLNASVYHLYTTDVMESVSYYDNGVNISTRANVGTNRKTGFELNGKYSPAKWFSVNGDFNYGTFNRKGEFENRNFDFHGEQWSSKFTLKFQLSKAIDLELSPNYQSAYKTVQGRVSGFASLDAGARMKVLKNKAVVSLAVRDVFASRIRESVVDQPDFSVYSFSQRGRFVTLGFSYSFGKGEVMTYSGGRRH